MRFKNNPFNVPYENYPITIKIGETTKKYQFKEIQNNHHASLEIPEDAIILSIEPIGHGHTPTYRGLTVRAKILVPLKEGETIHFNHHNTAHSNYAGAPR